MKRHLTYILALLTVLSCSEIPQQPPQPDPEDTERPLKFVFITDTHIGSNANNQHTRRCVEDINSLDSVDFVLMGGDLTDTGTDNQIAVAKDIFEMLDCPYYVVSGNHDSKWSESGCTTFSKTIGYEHFEFKAGGYRFIGCESGPDMRMGDALVSESSMRWLESLQPGKPVIFLNHYPLNTSMSNWFEVRRELIRLDCRLVIGGHVHRNSRQNYNGLPGFTGINCPHSSDHATYQIVTIRDGVVKVAQRHVYEDHAATEEPWFTSELLEVTDQVEYDSDGLPANYPHHKYSENTVSVLWRKEEDSNIGCGFAIDGSTAWYGTASGKLVAIDLQNGSTRWTRKFDGKIYSTPSVSEGIIVFACTDGSTYALNASTGATLWEYPGMVSVASPAIRNGAVYIGSRDGSFRCFDLKTGEIKWRYSGVAGFCDATPYVDDSQVVFGSWGGTLYCADITDGSKKWTWYREGGMKLSPGACTPLKSGNRIFVACPDRHTYCIDATNGKLLFVIDEGRESIALSEDSQTLFIKSMSGKALAVNAQILKREVTGTYAPDSPSKGFAWQPEPVLQTSQTLWYVDSGLGDDIASSALAECDGVLLIPSDRGCVHALDASNGSRLWVHKVGLGMTNPVSVWKKDGNLFILASTTDGKIELLQTAL